jgi:hypothetical protein
VRFSRDTVTDPTSETEQPPALDPRLQVIVDASEDDEVTCRHAILARGVDQGWLLRPEADELVVPDPVQTRLLYAALEGRTQPNLTEPDPWADGAPPVEPIDGDESGWVVLSQRCDLIRSYAAEPLVEVGHAQLLTAPGEARAARVSSPRIIAFADRPDGSCWAADLRQRAWLPKCQLPHQEPLIPAVDSDRRRKQFRLRLGQRYWRDPVPDDVVASLQQPLRDALDQSRARVALLRNFSAWLGIRNADGTVLIVAVAAEGRLADAERDWAEVLDVLQRTKPEAYRLIELPASGVFTTEDISLALWLSAFKFDFDLITYGRRADEDHAEPPT